jgi:hypothetical protein
MRMRWLRSIVSSSSWTLPSCITGERPACEPHVHLDGYPDRFPPLPAIAGLTRGSSSRRRSGRGWMRPTSVVTSVERSALSRASTRPNGHLASFGTRSSRCCLTRGALGDLAAGRACWDDRHGAGLSTPAQAGDTDRPGRHGSAVQAEGGPGMSHGRCHAVSHAGQTGGPKWT